MILRGNKFCRRISSNKICIHHSPNYNIFCKGKLFSIGRWPCYIFKVLVLLTFAIESNFYYEQLWLSNFKRNFGVFTTIYHSGIFANSIRLFILKLFNKYFNCLENSDDVEKERMHSNTSLSKNFESGCILNHLITNFNSRCEY